MRWTTERLARHVEREKRESIDPELNSGNQRVAEAANRSCRENVPRQECWTQRLGAKQGDRIAQSREAALTSHKVVKRFGPLDADVDLVNGTSEPRAFATHCKAVRSNLHAQPDASRRFAQVFEIRIQKRLATRKKNALCAKRTSFLEQGPSFPESEVR